MDNPNNKDQCNVQDKTEFLGKLARKFQDALLEFSTRVHPRIQLPQDEKSKVHAQIGSVIKMNSEASHTVLDLAKAQRNSFNTLKTQAEEALRKAPNASADELRILTSRLAMHAISSESTSNAVTKQLLATQECQEISERVLRNAEQFVSVVEEGIIEMVKLISCANIEDQLTLASNSNKDRNLTQEEVDAILEKLGF